MSRRTAERLLLVEGKSEKRVFPELLERCGIPWPGDPPPIWIEETNGFDVLLDANLLKTELKVRNRQADGVVFDHDETSDRRWERFRRACASFITIPVDPPKAGWTADHTQGPRIGAWMMPDNSKPGYLETFLLGLIPPEDPLLPYARDCVRGAREKGAGFPPRAEDKAVLHTWLAWQEKPGHQMHEAVKFKGLQPPIDDLFVKWVQRLFKL